MRGILRNSIPVAMAFVVATAQAQSSQLDAGIAALQANKRAEARAALIPYAKAHPKDAKGLAYVGRLLLIEGEALTGPENEKAAVKKYEEAADWLEKAVELDEKNGLYHRWLGDAYGLQAQRANKLRQAMLATKVKNEYEAAVRLDPKDIAARESIIEFYLQAPGFMGGSTEKAEHEAREIMKLDKLRGHYVMANVLSRQKKFDAAMAELKTAEREYPDSVAPGFRVLVFSMQQQKYDESWAQIDKLQKKFPDNRLVLFQVGRAAALSGQQLDRGEQAFRSYLAGATPDPAKGEPAFANAHYRLGMILEKKGSIPAARAAYTEALRLNPQLKDAKTALDKLPKA